MSEILDKALNELASVQLTDNTIAEAGEAHLEILNILYGIDKEYTATIAALTAENEALRTALRDRANMTEQVMDELDKQTAITDALKVAAQEAYDATWKSAKILSGDAWNKLETLAALLGKDAQK